LIWSEIVPANSRRIAFGFPNSDRLLGSYARAGVAKGAPDLVIWSEAGTHIRFVEVKCPDWDRPSEDQRLFHEAVRSLGSQCAIVEWRFSSESA
jgi:hypothetical protein